MIVHELTAAECHELLSRTSMGRLACVKDLQPYIVPISFALDPEANCLYGFSTFGQKIEWMRWNPRVCVAVDEIADDRHWTSVLVTGRYEELGLDSDGDQARQRAETLLAQRETWWLPATARSAHGDDRETPIVYCIHINRVSGRRTARPA
jgi:nitroimidazol reductase NimA-like FMN-containing flavoprotein (pyridoxamine 5'-phosphate oxidase superfamily)